MPINPIRRKINNLNQLLESIAFLLYFLTITVPTVINRTMRTEITCNGYSAPSRNINSPNNVPPID